MGGRPPVCDPCCEDGPPDPGGPLPCSEIQDFEVVVPQLAQGNCLICSNFDGAWIMRALLECRSVTGSSFKAQICGVPASNWDDFRIEFTIGPLSGNGFLRFYYYTNDFPTRIKRIAMEYIVPRANAIDFFSGSHAPMTFTRNESAAYDITHCFFNPGWPFSWPDTLTGDFP